MKTIRKTAWAAALACCSFANISAAAPAFRILYHETLHLQTRQTTSGDNRQMTFEAYGKQFNIKLHPNVGIRRAVPANRSDIEPMSGQIEGVSGSWVRLTHTRTGWRGVIADNEEVYAVEPASDVAAALVQPLDSTSAGTQVIYRLKDALLPLSPSYCGTADPAEHSSTEGQVTAKMVFDSIAADAASSSTGPSLRLMVGVVADYEFYSIYGDDSESTIISRMDIVDGIWSSQVGVKISLAPITVISTPNEPFTVTDPTSLLAQVRTYRASSTAQMSTGVTHLMTGRDLDGNIVGISYMGSVCNGDAADSLSEGGHSSLESALIAAHELGHNFNAPHDGVPGACASTPQTFLMAPSINFSSTFSACSLTQIHARIQTASCLTPYTPPDMAVEVTSNSVSAVADSAFTVSFVAHSVGDDPSTAVSATATLPTGLSFQSATADGGTCTNDTDSVTCTLGTLAPSESRKIQLSFAGAAAGSYSTTLAVASSNDSVASNNSAAVTIAVSAAASPTADSTTNGGTASSGGGGGGGELDVGVLMALAGAAGLAGVRRLSALRVRAGHGRF